MGGRTLAVVSTYRRLRYLIVVTAVFTCVGWGLLLAAVSDCVDDKSLTMTCLGIRDNVFVVLLRVDDSFML